MSSRALKSPCYEVSAVTGNLQLTFADVTIDLIAHRVQRARREIVLRHKEYQVLVYLLWHQGRVVSSAELYDRVFGLPNGRKSNTLNAHISRLRAALDSDAETSLIHTDAGVGFRLSASAECGTLVRTAREDPREALRLLAARRDVKLTELSRMLGRPVDHLRRFIRIGKPLALSEREHSALAAYFGVDETELGVRELWNTR